MTLYAFVAVAKSNKTAVIIMLKIQFSLTHSNDCIGKGYINIHCTDWEAGHESLNNDHRDT